MKLSFGSDHSSACLQQPTSLELGNEKVMRGHRELAMNLVRGRAARKPLLPFQTFLHNQVDFAKFTS